MPLTGRSKASLIASAYLSRRCTVILDARVLEARGIITRIWGAPLCQLRGNSDINETANGTKCGMDAIKIDDSVNYCDSRLSCRKSG